MSPFAFANVTDPSTSSFHYPFNTLPFLSKIGIDTTEQSLKSMTAEFPNIIDVRTVWLTPGS